MRLRQQQQLEYPVPDNRDLHNTHIVGYKTGWQDMPPLAVQNTREEVDTVCPMSD